MKKKNTQRRAAEFERAYGSEERVEFVKGEPCAACGVVGYSENAHLLGSDGMSRKGPSTEIGPLCGPQRVAGKMFPAFYVGCHRLYDEKRSEFYEQYPEFKPGEVAAQTEQRWLAYLNREDNA